MSDSCAWNVDRIQAIVAPAIERLIKDEELEGVSIESEGKNLACWWAKVFACGEVFQILVSDTAASESVEEGRERFFDQLQDEVAQSSFAWGELRR